MTKKAVRAAIILLTLITAGIYLAILGMGILEESGSIDFLFILNGLGYLTLLGFLLFGFPWGAIFLSALPLSPIPSSPQSPGSCSTVILASPWVYLPKQSKCS